MKMSFKLINCENYVQSKTLILLFVQGELKLKVEVWDVDDNNNDHVDFLSGVFGLKAARSQLEAPVAAFQIRKRTL